jgi:outer membrane lipoprotein SlyB
MQRAIRFALPALTLTLLSACANNQTTRVNEPVYSPSRAAVPGVVSYGVVRSIEASSIASDQPQGGGAVIGGILGAVVGRQFADGNHGRNVGTVVGAVGGAWVGNEVEKNVRRDEQGVRVNVQLDQGEVRSFEFKSAGDMRVGDRVRIEGNQLYRL